MKFFLLSERIEVNIYSAPRLKQHGIVAADSIEEAAQKLGFDIFEIVGPLLPLRLSFAGFKEIIFNNLPV